MDLRYQFTKAIVLLSFMISIASAFSFKAAQYEIRGAIVSANGTLIKLSYTYEGKDVSDSTVVMDGKFLLRGSFPESLLCTLSNSANQQIRIFLAQNTGINLSATIDKFYDLKIEGATENSLYQSFKNKSLELSGDYRKALAKAGGDLHQKDNPYLLSYRKRVDSLTIDFVKMNPNSVVAPLAMIDSYMNDNDRKLALQAYSLLTEENKKSFYAKRIKRFIDTEVNLEPGNLAPGFALKSLDGKVVNLSDYKGRYVLLDFWASWCPPCRAEHPLLSKLQQQYQKNIEVVSISMDAVNASWKQAVIMDNLSWTQLNDPKATNGEVADSYGIKSLPFNCIIDPNGRILATKVRGQKLEQFLADLFSK